MLLEELVERAAPDAAQGIVVVEGSEHLVPFLGHLAQRVVAPSEAHGTVVRIGAIGTSDVEESVRAAAEGLGEHDQLVLAVRATPDRLPVSVLVETLVACGLWVVEAVPAPARGVGCAFVVTLDDSVPWRSYLLGDMIPSTERSVLRLLAERAVEGLALRAQGTAFRKRNRELTLELDKAHLALEKGEAELGQLRQAIADRDAAAEADRSVAKLLGLVAVHAAELKDVTEELRRAQQAERGTRWGAQAKWAVSLIRHDPIHGSSRIMRSVVRRTRDRFSADQRHVNGATSESDDGSV